MNGTVCLFIHSTSHKRSEFIFCIKSVGEEGLESNTGYFLSLSNPTTFLKWTVETAKKSYVDINRIKKNRALCTFWKSAPNGLKSTWKAADGNLVLYENLF